MCNNKNFVIITDSASNLTEDILKKYDIKMLPYVINVDGEDVLCYEEGVDYESLAKEFYDKMRGGAKIKTSLINGERFIEFVEPYLKDGSDVLFLGLSSGVSGTFNSVNNACAELSEKYPERKCMAADTLAAGFGEGLLVLEAVKMRDKGLKIEKVKENILAKRMKLKQVFTVDSLEYLMKGGRISKLTAVVGTLLQIKPLLKGNDEGKIISYGRVKGKKRALDALVKEYIETADEKQNQVIAIAHCDCLEDADYVANKIKENSKAEIIVKSYDMCTGSYVGPGTVALFFWSDKR